MSAFHRCSYTVSPIFRGGISVSLDIWSALLGVLLLGVYVKFSVHGGFGSGPVRRGVLVSLDWIHSLGVLHLSGELVRIDMDLQGLYLLALDTRGNFGVIWI
jgi:hypothetical protein